MLLNEGTGLSNNLESFIKLSIILVNDSVIVWLKSVGLIQTLNLKKFGK